MRGRLFAVEQYELHASTYHVRARTAGEAVSKVFEGDGDLVDNSLEFIEIAEQYGLPIDVCPELVKELEACEAEHLVGSDAISGLRSVTALDEEH